MKESGVSRATIYRHFPGRPRRAAARDGRLGARPLFIELGDHVRDAPDLAELLERGLEFAHRSVQEHEVLRKMLDTEPERLLPLLTTESTKSLPFIADFLHAVPRARGATPAGSARASTSTGPPSTSPAASSR